MTDATERATRVRNEALNRLESAADEDSKLARMEEETDAIETFATEFAKCLQDGVNNSQVSPYAALVADASKWHTKTDVRQQIQTALEELDGKGKTPFDDVVRERLRSVQVIRTTDHKQGTTYRWEFADCTIETEGGGGKNRRGHFNWNNFRDLYLEASGNDAAKPQSDFRGGDEWRSFIVDMIDERGTSTTFEGPRTVAVKELANRIRNSNGYGTLGAMVDRDGVYVDLPRYNIPEWWGTGQPFEYERPSDHDLPGWWGQFAPRTQEFYPPKWYGHVERPPLEPHEDRSPPQECIKEVRIPNHLATRVAENNEITPRALQVELNARGHVPPRMGGRVSETKWVNGNERTWWVLSPDLATPQVYIPQPASAAKQEAAKAASKTEQTDDETGGMKQVGDL